MTRARRRPFDPSAKVHDRRAAETNRGIAGHMAAIEIDDPYEAGGKIIAMRSTRNDPLAGMHARKTIDEAQYHAGRAYQKDFEEVERGPQAIDPSKEHVDGGLPADPLPDSRAVAVDRLKRVHRDLGLDGCAIVQEVLIHGMGLTQIAAHRKLSGVRWELYFGKRFGECLDRLARTYGLSNGERE